MTIVVKCFATLASFQPDDPDAFPVEAGDTIAQVMARLGISPEAVALIFVNNVHRQPETVLQDGDIVGLFPPIGGG